jgi:cell division transport system permease protein
MSMTNAIDNNEPHPVRTSAAAEAEEHVETPIVPQATIAGRALTAVVAIMTFLASLTLGAVIMVRAATQEWQANVAREVTIQIRPATGRDIESDVARAAAIARTAPGVAEARPYTKEEASRLLEPWLGIGLQFDDLPMPRMVVVRLTPGGATDLPQLRRQLSEQIAGATLDDHRGFVDRMRAMSSAVLLAGLAVLALVFAATILSVTFATNAAMAANQPVIEVLHLIGARDSFIAGHFQRHFLQLGLRGGLIGGGAAIALFALAELASGWLAGPAGGDQLAALFGNYSLGPLGYLSILVLVGLVAFATAVTSRRTVNRTIAEAH